MAEGSNTPEVVTQPTKSKGPSQQLRQFSRENSVQERQVTAQAIRAKRAEYFDKKNSLASRRDEIAQQAAELDAQTEGKLEELAQIEETLGELSSSWYSRALHVLEIQRLKGKTGGLQASQSQIDDALKILKMEEGEVARRLGLKGADGLEFDDAKRLLKDFYHKERNKWEYAPLSKEDIKRYFSEEYLSSLSTDDYYELLSRYPGHMVGHVTRQGIRDHTGHYAHTTGVGEYHDGFTQILKDGKLKSPLGTYLKDGVKKEAIVQFLGLNGMDKEGALKYLAHMRNRYADKTSIHFAIGRVADAAYGGETGNEIFFSFPSAFIASNFYFEGTASIEMGLDSDWNDQWVFPQNESDGININAGVVNIPRSALVSPRTGSKYELDEDNNPIKEGDSFKLAVDTISSKQYWEKYFLEHPDQAPKHIVWYEGDPTSIINYWRYTENVYLQFNENLGYPPGLDEKAKRFYEMGKEAIEEYYPQQPVAV